MQDLSTIRGDGAPAPSGPPPPGPGRASGKHGQPKMSRSASESAGSSGRCHFPSPLFHLVGLAFVKGDPGPPRALAPRTRHPYRRPSDRARPAKGQSTTWARAEGWPWGL